MTATKPFSRDDLNACSTWNDANELFLAIHIEDLMEYVGWVEAAQKYLELTNRDLFLLEVAKSRYDFRMEHLSTDEWTASLDRQEAISKAKFNAYCEQQAAKKAAAQIKI